MDTGAICHDLLVERPVPTLELEIHLERYALTFSNASTWRGHFLFKSLSVCRVLLEALLD